MLAEECAVAGYELLRDFLVEKFAGLFCYSFAQTFRDGRAIGEGWLGWFGRKGELLPLEDIPPDVLRNEVDVGEDLAVDAEDVLQIWVRYVVTFFVVKGVAVGGFAAQAKELADGSGKVEADYLMAVGREPDRNIR